MTRMNRLGDFVEPADQPLVIDYASGDGTGRCEVVLCARHARRIIDGLTAARTDFHVQPANAEWACDACENEEIQI